MRIFMYIDDMKLLVAFLLVMLQAPATKGQEQGVKLDVQDKYVIHLFPLANYISLI